ncbi:uncharacterized protein LOC109021768 isoform X3 [Juglans regia]|uniref:Uncharacterized protein LOC109021768 isoform X3 n=1 Tax=Juglans regia TaxID=51240 RepID=A0A6P9EU94_JUGRE|nr:uncharacterized protein LOC109021768 isoform X3 [Juglans regia]
MAEASAQCLQEEHEENPYSISIAVNLHHWLICVAAAHILNDASFKVVICDLARIKGYIWQSYSYRLLISLSSRNGSIMLNIVVLHYQNQKLVQKLEAQKIRVFFQTNSLN